LYLNTQLQTSLAFPANQTARTEI